MNKTDKIIITLRIPKVLKKKIIEKAMQEKRNMTSMATIILEDYFDERLSNEKRKS